MTVDWAHVEVERDGRNFHSIPRFQPAFTNKDLFQQKAVPVAVSIPCSDSWPVPHVIFMSLNRNAIITPKEQRNWTNIMMTNFQDFAGAKEFITTTSLIITWYLQTLGRDRVCQSFYSLGLRNCDRYYISGLIIFSTRRNMTPGIPDAPIYKLQTNDEIFNFVRRLVKIGHSVILGASLVCTR